MNKWEDSFKRTEHCSCSSNQGLFVSNRQLSFIVAGALFFFFFTFITGYFLGKKNMIEHFSDQLHQEAFADQVYASVVANMTEDESPAQLTSPVLLAETSVPVADAIVEVANNTHTNYINEESTITSQVTDSGERISLEPLHYYAQLIGFGTEKAAQQFVKKLATKEIEAEVRKRTSKTAKGRTSYWYQVVTVAHANKDELIALVDRIAREENIKGAQIRTC